MSAVTPRRRTSGPPPGWAPFAVPPAVREAGVLALLAASALLGLTVAPDRGLTPTAVVIAVAPLIPLPWRHLAPLRVFVTTELLAVGARVAFGPNNPSDLIVLVALFAVASRRGPWWTTAAVALDVVLLGVASASSGLPPDQLRTELLGQVVFGVVVALFGAYIAARRSHLRALEDHAEHLARTSELEARAAVDEERRRIARELHDVVAHHVSVMTLHAGALQHQLHAAGADVELAAAAGEVRTTGREAMQELRRLLDVLHQGPDGGPTMPQPTLRDLDALVERMRHVGMPVALTTTGPVDEVPAGVALTIFRITQEALTNTLRHAGPVPTEIRVTADARALELEVRDHGTSGEPPAYPLGARTGGNGIAGMRERAALYGGRLTAGRHPEGGFVVTAVLPRVTPAA